MKNILNYTVLFLLTIQTGWCNDFATNLDSYTQIECTLRPIERGGPKGSGGSYPHLHIKESTSSNWSGYAAATSLSHPATGAVTNVSGAWTVPALSSTETDAYSAIWVGIDGYSSGTVEQLGTEQDWINGSQQNYAWFEMYPQDSYEIVNFPVDIGDEISAEVQYMGNYIFKLSMVNHTKQVTTVVPQSHTKSKVAKRSSAEWIVEAPADNSGVLPLADFVTANWTSCSATIKGKTGAINNSHWNYDQINMEGDNNVVKAVTSNLTNSGTAFSVSWDHE